MEIFLGNNFEITKSGANEGFIRKAPKRLKNQIDKVKQSKKDRNRMQKKIENAYERFRYIFRPIPAICINTGLPIR